MLHRRPLAHIHPGFREDVLNGKHIDSINRGQIHPGDLIPIGAQVKVRRILALLFLLARRERVLVDVHLELESSVASFQFLVTRHDLLAVHIIEINRLSQGEEVFRPVIAFE